MGNGNIALVIFEDLFINRFLIIRMSVKEISNNKIKFIINSLLFYFIITNY